MNRRGFLHGIVTLLAGVLGIKTLLPPRSASTSAGRVEKSEGRTAFDHWRQGAKAWGIETGYNIPPPKVMYYVGPSEASRVLGRPIAPGTTGEVGRIHGIPIVIQEPFRARGIGGDER